MTALPKNTQTLTLLMDNKEHKELIREAAALAGSPSINMWFHEYFYTPMIELAEKQVTFYRREKPRWQVEIGRNK